MSPFTHLDSEGHPLMVDVSEKTETHRIALAEAFVYLPEKIYTAVAGEGLPKGDVLRIAETAGVMASKQTPDLIPLCHNIRLDSCKVKCHLRPESLQVHIQAETIAREVTGVEMEALTAVTVAALTIYDMCKGIDKGMIISGVRLLRKSGGKSGLYTAESDPQNDA